MLGGAALTIAAGDGEADETAALRLQLEMLKARVGSLETEVASGGNARWQPPQSEGWISFHRGSDIGWNRPGETRPGDRIPEDRGFTIAITPSADLPAPVHEVAIAGYVRGDFIYDTRQDLGDSFGATFISGGPDREHVRLHARQSRFRIGSRSRTAVGEVRTVIEGDFFGFGGDELVSNSDALRLRLAWGEWNITPNVRLRVGQDWSNFMNLFAGPTTVDFNGPLGIAFIRQAQVRLTYEEEGWLFAVAVENPETDVTIGSAALAAAINAANLTTAAAVGAGCSESLDPVGCELSDNMPDLTARLQFEAPDGSLFQLSGVARNLRVDGDLAGGITGSDSEFAWGILAAAAVDLTDNLNLKVTANYGDGIGRYIVGGPFGSALLTGTLANPVLRSIEAWGVAAALGISVNESTTLNFVLGHLDRKRGDIVAGMNDDVTTVHSNIMWQPVTSLRMGFEVMWGRNDVVGAGTNDAVRFQLGTDFYF